jgi:hypothetical protein
LSEFLGRSKVLHFAFVLFFGTPFVFFGTPVRAACAKLEGKD